RRGFRQRSGWPGRLHLRWQEPGDRLRGARWQLQERRTPRVCSLECCLPCRRPERSRRDRLRHRLRSRRTQSTATAPPPGPALSTPSERRFAFLLRGADGPSGRRCCCGWCGRLAFPWRGPTEQSSYQGPAPGNGSTRFGALRFLSNRTQAAAATLATAPTKCRENQHAFALRSRMPLRAEAGEALLAPTEEGLVAVGRVVPQEARAVGAAVGLGE